MIPREITERLSHLAGKFPVVLLTGPRQSGKSTLLKHAYPDSDYVSLEEPDVRLQAESDPRGFLKNFQGRTIIDEAQRVPSLFSYIQGIVDKENTEGRFLLSGSQNFLLIQSISQSLAGRAAVLKLLPFSCHELMSAQVACENIDLNVFTGAYPRISDKNLTPDEFYPNYIQTYVERDVRLLRNVADLSQFIRFIKLCAGRIGRLLNVASLASDCGINVLTANAWLSILETSYIAFLLKPYHKNFNKRLTKSPKLYFYDTGLACSLLGIESEKQLQTHYLHGELFENWVILEYVKRRYSMAREPRIYFWRESSGTEIDLLIEENGQLNAVEIKSSATMNDAFFKGLNLWQKISGEPRERCHVVFCGERNFEVASGAYLTWQDWVNPLDG